EPGSWNVVSPRFSTCLRGDAGSKFPLRIITRFAPESKQRIACGRKKAARFRAAGLERGVQLLRDPVDAIAGFTLRRLDIDFVLLAGGRNESASAVRLPVGSFHDLGERRTLRASDQLQDLRALALGTRCSGLGLPFGFGGLLSDFGFLLRCGSLGGFLGFGRA